MDPEIKRQIEEQEKRYARLLKESGPLGRLGLRLKVISIKLNTAEPALMPVVIAGAVFFVSYFLMGMMFGVAYARTELWVSLVLGAIVCFLKLKKNLAWIKFLQDCADSEEEEKN